MAEIRSLHDAVEELIHDGDTVALEGFTHLIPFAAAHEIIRQGITGLTLARMTPDVVYDQLIGAGAARKLVFSWGGNPGVGSLHRFRDAVENGWPAPLEIDEHSHAGMANRYAAGALEAPVRGAARLPGQRHPRPARPPSPPSPAPSPARSWPPSPRSTPTSPSSTPSRPTAPATSSCGAWQGCRRRRRSPRGASWSPSRRSSTPWSPAPAASSCPPGSSTRSPLVPGGAHPSYAAGYSVRDNAFYQAWDAISRDREAFGRWVEESVRSAAPERTRAASGRRQRNAGHGRDRRARPRPLPMPWPPLPTAPATS